MIFFDLFPKEKIKIDQFAHILGEKTKNHLIETTEIIFVEYI